MLLQSHFPLQQVLQQALLHYLVTRYGLHNQECEVWIFLIFALPVFEGLQIALFVHVFTTFSQFLIMYDIDVGALLGSVFKGLGILLQSFQDELFVSFLFKSKGKQSNPFVVDK